MRSYSAREMRFLLSAVNERGPSGILQSEDKRVLYDRLAKSYLNKLVIADLSDIDFGDTSFAGLDHPDIARLIIHVLAALTGFSESSISMETSLSDDLRLTTLKRESLRKRINDHLKEIEASDVVTTTEIGKCLTVKDVYDVTIGKLA